MNQFVYVIILLFIISSCSTLDSFNDLTNRADPKYKIIQNGKASFIATVPTMSYTKRKEVLSSIGKNDSLSDNDKIRIFLEFIDEFSINRYFDSVGTLNIYFDERYLNPNLKLESFYYWDYTNIRFLIPFLIFGNEEHKRNQCVNRAIEAGYLRNMDAVVISPTLNHFKLYKNQSFK